MNLKMIGIIIAIVGVVLLLVALILGIVIGLNDQTVAEIMNKDENSESDFDDVKAAEESNALLMPVNMGLSAFGMGLTFIGAGMALAKDNKGNMLAMAFGIVAAVILLIALVLSIYLGMLNSESMEIYNKDFDERKESDGDRLDEIQESEAFLTPVSYWLGGFWFGSLGLGLAVLTLVFGGACAMAGGKPAPAAPTPPVDPGMQQPPPGGDQPPPPPPPAGGGGQWGGQPQQGYGQPQQGGYDQQQQGGWQQY